MEQRPHHHLNHDFNPSPWTERLCIAVAIPPYPPLSGKFEATPINHIKNREKRYPFHGGKGKCAMDFGVSPQMWSNWETGRSTPDDANQAKLAEFFGISLSQLRGEEPQPSENVGDSGLLAPVSRYVVPVIGLASCDVAGWYSPTSIAIRAPLPVNYPNPDDLFAVIAVGSSMIPDGIREGYLLFCDSKVVPQPGDTIYVKMNDGRATIKRFLKNDDKYLFLQGWLDPEDNGYQKPFVDKRAISTIDFIASVVIVQRKA